jgi:hypothetical protein
MLRRLMIARIAIVALVPCHLGLRSPAAIASDDVAIVVGMIAHGQRIPLPRYSDGAEASPAECVWQVFPRTIQSGHDRTYGYTAWADGARNVHLDQITLHGTFYDPVGMYLIVAIRGRGAAEVAVRVGDAGHGDTLPLPVYSDGMPADVADCVYLATPRWLSTGVNSLLGYDGFVDQSRVGYMAHVSYAGTNYIGRVNYIVMAKRPDPTWGVVAAAGDVRHGELVPIPSVTDLIPHHAGAFVGTGILETGHDATLGFDCHTNADRSLYFSQTTIAGGGSTYFDSVARYFSVVSGPLMVVSAEASTWGQIKRAFAVR